MKHAPWSRFSRRTVAVAVAVALAVSAALAVLTLRYADAAQAATATGARIASVASAQLTSGHTGEDSTGCNFYTGAVGRPSSGCATHGWGLGEWCADFSKYVWSQAGGVVDLSALDSWAHSFRQYGIDHRTWHTPGGYTPQPGDAIVYPDLNGNGMADHVGIVVAVSGATVTSVEGNYGDRVSKRTGSASRAWGYTAPVSSDRTADTSPVRDVSGDGRDDVMSVTPSSDGGTAITAYESTGSGATPHLAWIANGGSANLAYNTAKFTSGDINGDHHADIIFAKPNTTGGTTLGAWLSYGTGYTGAVILTQSSLNPAQARLLSGDVDGDGRDDIMAITPTATGTSITAYRASGTDATPHLAWIANGGSANLAYNTAKFTSGDINGDHHADIIFAKPNTTGGTTLGAWLSYGTGYTGAVILTQSSLNPARGQLLSGDVDGDGRDDIMAITPTATGTSITAYRASGSGATPHVAW